MELLNGASGNTIFDSVISANSGNGVVLTGVGTSNNTVASNLIGTDDTGTHALGNGGSGVVINLGATNNTVRSGNVLSGNGPFGVYILNSGTTGNTVSGNFIGTDITGEHALGNGVTGVELAYGASSNTIGSGNVISGNTWDGVTLYGSSNNVITGNYIGTDATGTHALPNGNIGVPIFGGSSSNTISGNVISGNAVTGIWISDPGTSYNTVAGDFIGTNAAGNAALGNGVDGVQIVNGATYNVIGGTTTTARDVLSGNGSSNVAIAGTGTSDNVVEGDYIGTDATGSYAVGNMYFNYGVRVSGGASSNTIGGLQAGPGT